MFFYFILPFFPVFSLAFFSYFFKYNTYLFFFSAVFHISDKEIWCECGTDVAGASLGGWGGGRDAVM